VKREVSALKKLRWLGEAALFLAISHPIAIIPDRLAYPFGRWLGRLFFRLLKKRRTVAIANIAASMPFLEQQQGWDPANGTPEDIARKTFENLGMSIVENFKVYHGRGQSIIDAVEFIGLEHFEAAKAKNKGIALICGHCGNWELCALAYAARFHSISVVAKRQSNIYMNEMMEKIRSRFGNRVIYSAGALRAMIGEFKKNNLVVLLIDQAVKPEEGYLISFLGRTAWTNKMPALMARKTGVTLLPAIMHREKDKHVVVISEPMYSLEGGSDEEGGLADTARLAAVLEDYIVHHPTEWYWVHNRWKRAGEPAPRS
jgi:KDO2-lipid IV(A) lauroyltransferase